MSWRFEGVAPISLSHWGMIYMYSGDVYRTCKAIVAAEKGKSRIDRYKAIVAAKKDK